MMEIDATEEVHLVLSNLTDETIDTVNSNYVIKTQNEQVAVVDNADEIEFFNVAGESGSWEANFRIRGVFLGKCYQTVVFNCIPSHLNFKPSQPLSFLGTIH